MKVFASIESEKFPILYFQQVSFMICARAVLHFNCRVVEWLGAFRMEATSEMNIKYTSWADLPSVLSSSEKSLWSV